MWTASSGSDPKLAYVLEVVAGVVRSCSCPAGEFGDPCCKHAARFYLDAGLVDPEPEGSPPASAAAVVCFRCRGIDAACAVCVGAGLASLTAQAAALVAASQGRCCDHCGGPLDDESATDDALQTVCGACVAETRREAETAVAAAIAEAHEHRAWERAQLAA